MFLIYTERVRPFLFGDLLKSPMTINDAKLMTPQYNTHIADLYSATF